MSDITSPASEHPDHHDVHAGSHLGIRATTLILSSATLILAIVAFREKAQLADAQSHLNQATSEMTQARSDADNFKAQTAALTKQLDTARDQASGLQKQIAADQTQVSDLHAQVAEAQTAQGNLRLQLNAAKQEASRMQSEVSRASEGESDARSQLAQTKAHAADLQSQLDKATSAAASPQPAASRALPVTATFEKSFWGKTYTMHVRNQGPDPLTINITVEGGPVKAATIQPGATFDVADLGSGAGVVLSGDGFGPTDLTVK